MSVFLEFLELFGALGFSSTKDRRVSHKTRKKVTSTAITNVNSVARVGVNLIARKKSSCSNADEFFARESTFPYLLL